MTTTVALRDLTTLQIGGPALDFVEVATCQEALAQYKQAQTQGWPVLVLGGGSNVLVSDQGFAGLVLRWQDRSLEVVEQSEQEVLVRVGGGWVWDQWVAEAIRCNWAGLECLSGIPGCVGAAPIQNIGAYGQEVAELIDACWVLEWDTGRHFSIAASECGFAYRKSHFKQAWKGRYLVTAVDFRLRTGGSPWLRYKELQQAMQGRPQTLIEVRQVVMDIRRSKSMLWDLDDPNHRSAGSFFLNPIVKSSQVQALTDKFPHMPGWPAGEGCTKLSAAWLIEHAGLNKGWGKGRAGLSSKHVLAIINRGDALAEDILQLARTVRQAVRERFAIDLVPEPEFVGFNRPLEELL